MKYCISGPYPPAIFKAPSGKWYVTSGNVWVEIPENTDSNSIRWDNTLNQYLPTRRVPVPNKPYIFTFNQNKVSCSCQGFMFRKSCKHITEYFKSQLSITTSL